jgi:hypothetical protein
MDRRQPSLLLLGVLACAPAIGAEPGSTFIDFEFQKPNHGDQAAGARVAALLGQRMFLDAAADIREHRGGGVGMGSLGVGWNLLPSGPASMVLGLSADAVVGDFGPEDEPGGMSGASGGAGVNWIIAYRFSERFELQSRLKLTTIESSPWVTTIGARFYLWQRLALAADFQKDDFGTLVGIGLRLDLSRH